jgi:rhamnulokinase
MNAKTYVACDLGAESGRVICGSLAKGTVDLEESYRFTTGPSTVSGSLRWNILRFFDEIKRGLSAVYTAHGQIDGLSVDAWANDYAYFSKSDPLLALDAHERARLTGEKLSESYAEPL